MTDPRRAPPTLSLSDVQAARQRIGDGVVATSCRRSFALERRTDVRRVRLKAEFRQRTGSFKDRGSLNKLLVTGDEARRRGVVAASAGNHAQALAYHAARLDVPCTIVMPETAPLIKVANTKRHGARVLQTGRTLSDGMEAAERIVARGGGGRRPRLRRSGRDGGPGDDWARDRPSRRRTCRPSWSLWAAAG